MAKIKRKTERKIQRRREVKFGKPKPEKKKPQKRKPKKQDLNFGKIMLYVGAAFFLFYAATVFLGMVDIVAYSDFIDGKWGNCAKKQMLELAGIPLPDIAIPTCHPVTFIDNAASIAVIDFLLLSILIMIFSFKIGGILPGIRRPKSLFILAALMFIVGLVAFAFYSWPISQMLLSPLTLGVLVIIFIKDIFLALFSKVFVEKLRANMMTMIWAFLIWFSFLAFVVAIVLIAILAYVSPEVYFGDTGIWAFYVLGFVAFWNLLAGLTMLPLRRFWRKK